MYLNLKRKLVVSVLIGFFILILILANVPNDTNLLSKFQDMSAKTSVISNKIRVNDNWTATRTAGICTGEGTSSNPYVIEDLEINAQTVGSCIIIENSTEHFIIRNCTLINSGSAERDAGVQLTNISNAQIINNTLIDNHVGIHIDISLNFIISKNSCSNDRDLRILYSDNALIYLNSFKSTSLNLYLRNTTFSCRSPKKFIYIYNENTYTSYLGNYWSGYNDNDNDGDGIGDTIHKFYDSTILNVDYYPLIEDANNYQIVGISEGEAIPGYNLIMILGILGILCFTSFKRYRRKNNFSEQ
jgi:parallel beta-helix repeat protein